MQYLSYMEKDEFLLNGRDDSISKSKMGVVNLRQGHFLEAKSLFDDALSMTSNLPLAWLGKTFAEANLMPFEGINFDQIKVNLDQFDSMFKDEQVRLYNKAEILLLIVARLCTLSKSLYESAEQLQNEAGKQRLKSAGSVVASSVLSSTMQDSNKRSSQALSDIVMVAGIMDSVSHTAKADNLEQKSKEHFQFAKDLSEQGGQVYQQFLQVYSGLNDFNKENLREDYGYVKDSISDIQSYYFAKVLGAIRSIRSKFVWNIGRAVKQSRTFETITPFKEFFSSAAMFGLNEHETSQKVIAMFAVVNNTVQEHGKELRIVRLIKHVLAWGLLVIAAAIVSIAGVTMPDWLSFTLIFFFVASFFIQYTTQNRIRAEIKTLLDFFSDEKKRISPDYLFSGTAS